MAAQERQAAPICAPVLRLTAAVVSRLNARKRCRENVSATRRCDLTVARWKKILLGAERRGVQVPLTQAEAWDLFLRQGSRCALTGRAVTISEANLNYYPRQPRWVHRDVAKLLAGMSEDRLREIARELVNASKVPPEASAAQVSVTTDRFTAPASS